MKGMAKVNTGTGQDAYFVRPGEGGHMNQVLTLTVEVVEVVEEEGPTSGPVDRGS